MAQTVQEIRTDFNGTTGGSGGTMTTAASGSAFIILVSCDQSVTITVNNDSKGNSYTAAAAGVAISGNNQVKAYYATSASPTGGSGHSANVTFSGNAFGSFYFIEVTNSTSGAIDAYNTATYNPHATPYPVTSGTPAQSDYTVLSICGTTGGGPNNYTATGYTLDSQGDGTTYWPSAIGYKVVTGGGSAETCNWDVTGTSDALDIILLVKASAGGGGATYTPPANPSIPEQYFTSAPQSFAPMMRFATAAATALAVTAGAYVPVGAKAAQQAQVAYREAARLTAQPGPDNVLPQPAAITPTKPTTVIQPPPWMHHALEQWRLDPLMARFGAITAVYGGAVKIPQVPAPAWPYTLAQVEPWMPIIPAATQVPFKPALVPASAAWGYVSAALEQPIPFTQGITPAYALSPVLTPVREPEWPYAATMLPAPSASRYAVNFVPPWTGPVRLTRGPEWPYAATLVPPGTASRFSAGPPAYFGQSPVRQWLSMPPWPFAATMLRAPTASQFGTAPPPPPVSTGPNGLRRWAIQQYEAYFTQRDLRRAKEEQAKRQVPEPALPRKIHWRKTEALRGALPDEDLQSAMRLAHQLSAGAIDLEIRLTTLEQRQAAIAAIPKTPVPTPSAQQVGTEEEDDLLLLAILFGEDVWRKKL